MIYAILWSVPTSIIVMSFLYGMLTLNSMIRGLQKKVWVSVNPHIEDEALPSIAIFIPLYKEDKHSIEETFKSIASQRYPRQKLGTYIILEKDDEATKSYVEEVIEVFRVAGIRTHIYVNNDKRKSKANAMNMVLRDIVDSYDAVLVVDAGDRIPDEYYILKCAEMIRKGYSIVGTRVYRVGEETISRLSYIDTVLWYNIGLPGIHSFTKVPFVSGEGMAVTTEFLKRIGGFPEVLAEDTYLAMLSFIYKEKVVLIDNMILEGGPSDIRSLFRQRLRWYRGILQCLRDLIIKYRKNLTKVDVIRAFLTYVRIIVLIAPFLSLLIVIAAFFIYVPQYALTVAYVELLSLFVSPIFIRLTNGIRDPLLFLAPLNWLLQSFIAFIAIMPIRISWLRTTSRSSVELPT